MDFSFLLNGEFVVLLIQGMALTIVMSVLSVFLGAILGVFPALGRLSKRKWLSWPATVYVEVIRGTPLLVLLILIYATITIPSVTVLSVDISTFIPGIIALVINSSAYVAELIRGGINSVDVGQKEAALSLGMSESRVMRKIVFPQAIKHIIPSLGNEFVSMIKETSIVYNIGVAELMYSAEFIKNQTYAIKEVYIVVAILYMLLTIPTSQMMGLLERRLKKNER